MNGVMTQREAARALLFELFTDRKRIAISEVLGNAAGRGISRRTMTRACQDVGVTAIQNGRLGGFWEKTSA